MGTAPNSGYTVEPVLRKESNITKVNICGFPSQLAEALDFITVTKPTWNLEGHTEISVIALCLYNNLSQ